MQGETASDKPLRVGVIGLGWAGDVHIKAYQQVPGVQVVAIAEINPQRLEQIGDTYAIPLRYRTYEELLARDDLDAVSVTTPNQFHAPASILAFERGLHVLCEKPLARTAEEGAAMVAAAQRAERVLQVAFNHRARSDVQVLKRYIDAGSLGRIYHAKASWMRRSGIPGGRGWFTSRELAGGGPLIDLGVHVLDMVLHLLGEPEPIAVSAATYAELGPRGRGGEGSRPLANPNFEVEDLATAFVRLAGGATLLLEASWAAYGSAGDDYGVSLYGTEGGAEIAVKNYSWEDTLRIFTDVGGVPAEIRPRLSKGEFHQSVIREFVAAVRSGNWMAYTGAQGLRRARLIDACYTSARLGREVTLEPSAASEA